MTNDLNINYLDSGKIIGTCFLVGSPTFINYVSALNKDFTGKLKIFMGITFDRVTREITCLIKDDCHSHFFFVPYRILE